jgi:hypothetical protein
MVRTSLTRPLWWTAARMGLCLASVGDTELQRLLFKRLRWIVLWAGGAAGFAILGNGLAAAPPPPSGSNAPIRTLSMGAYLVAAVLGLIAAMIWLYARIIVRRALRDRIGYPIPCKGTVRGLITAREGGWVVRLRSEQGRWLWLTGTSEALAPMRQRMALLTPGRPYRLSVVLTYYRKSRVIHEITGMAVEQLDAALANSGSRQVAAEQPGYASRR